MDSADSTNKVISDSEKSGYSEKIYGTVRRSDVSTLAAPDLPFHLYFCHPFLIVPVLKLKP